MRRPCLQSLLCVLGAVALVGSLLPSVEAAWPDACIAPQVVDTTTSLSGSVGLACDLQSDPSCTYDNDMTCQWVFEAQVDMYVTFQFDWIDLEQPEAVGCSFDYVEITSDVNDTVLLKACGDTTPTPVSSGANEKLTVTFHSDEYEGGSGFKLDWAVASDSGGDDPLTDDPDESPLVACGNTQPEVINYDAGAFGVGSPDSAPKADEDACTWKLEPKAGYTVRAAVAWINAGDEEDPCTAERLMYRVGAGASQAFCGGDANAIPSIVSSQTVLFQWVGNPAPTVGTGFQVEYSIAQDVGFEPGYPNLRSVSNTSTVIDVRVTAPAAVAVLLMLPTAPEPTATEVFSNTQVEGWLAGGAFSIADALKIAPVSFTHLDEGERYVAYFAVQAESDPTDKQYSVYPVAFQTLGSAAAPSFVAGSPLVNVTGPTSASVTLALSASGNVWLLCVGGQGYDLPSSAQVADFQAPVGVGTYYQHTEMVLVGQAPTFQMTDLDAQSEYTLYVVSGDLSNPPVLQDAPSAYTFTTTGAACEVSAWGQWGACSVECGEGVQTRTRTVTQDGPACPTLSDEQACFPGECVSEACGANQPRAMATANGTFGIGVKGADLYEPFSSCSWVIPAQPGQVTHVWFNWFDVWAVGDVSCSGDKVVISDGTAGAVPLLKACGHSVNDTHEVTATVDLVVTFSSTQFAAGTGFEIQYLSVTEAEKVDCEVGEWSSWAECSAECDGGVTKRTRDVLVPAQNGGMACPELIEHDTCNPDPCPDPACSGKLPVMLTASNGTITKTQNDVHFSSATSCSWIIVGGQGKTIRAWFTELSFDSCHPDGVHLFRGDSLEGESLMTACGPTLPAELVLTGDDLRVEFVDLNFLSLPTFTLNYVIEEAGQVQDCVVSEWTQWSDCSKSCKAVGGDAGTQTRSRFIEAQPQNGGQACPAADDLTDSRTCNDFACEDAACGAGQPSMLNDAQGSLTFGGTGQEGAPATDCSWRITAGPTDTVRVYFTQLSLTTSFGCADTYVELTASTGSLEKLCGVATDFPAGEVSAKGNVDIKFHGQAYSETFAISWEVETTGEKVDCQMSQWSDPSLCSSACGGGVSTQTREVLVPASNGGTPCGALTQNTTCCAQACSNRACEPGGVWHLTDDSNSLNFGGVGTCNVPAMLSCQWVIDLEDSEDVTITVDTINLQANDLGQCDANYVAIHAGQTKQDNVLGRFCGSTCQDCTVVVSGSAATSGGALIEITAEQQPGQGFGLHYQKHTTGSVDCIASAWQPWSPCSADCGGGTQTRTRSVLVQKQGAGLDCGDLTAQQACNTVTCPQAQTDAATLTVTMRSSLPWSNGLTQFITDFTNNVALALNIAIERVAVISVGGTPLHSSRRLDASLEVVFQIMPSHDGTGPEVTAVVNTWQAQLRDQNSALLTATATRYIDVNVATQVAYASPAQLQLSESIVTFDGSRNGYNLNVRNSGGSDLVISRIYQATPVAPWLTVRPTVMTLHGGQSGQISLSVNPSLVDDGAYFQVVEMEHNDPSGKHAFGVALTKGEGGTNGDDDVFEAAGFMPGLAAGAGGLVGACIVLALLGCFIKRKVVPCCRTVLGLNVRQLRREKFSRLDSQRNNGDDDASDAKDGLELKSVAVEESTHSQMDDGEDDRGGFERPTFAPAPAKPSIKLKADPAVLAPQVFERKWEELSTLEIWGATLRNTLTDQQLETVLGAENIVCMASGVIDDLQKFYFYAEAASNGDLYMAEVSFSTTTRRLSAVIKGPTGGNSFVRLFKQSLGNLIGDDL